MALSLPSHVSAIEEFQGPVDDDGHREDGQVVHEVLLTLSGTMYPTHLGQTVSVHKQSAMLREPAGGPRGRHHPRAGPDVSHRLIEPGE